MLVSNLVAQCLDEGKQRILAEDMVKFQMP